jgi:hypothetical protein
LRARFQENSEEEVDRGTHFLWSSVRRIGQEKIGQEKLGQEKLGQEKAWPGKSLGPEQRYFDSSLLLFAPPTRLKVTESSES